MTRYYKTPACATRLLHGGPKAAIHLRAPRLLSPVELLESLYLASPSRRDGTRNLETRTKLTSVSTVSLAFSLLRLELPLWLFPLPLLFR